MSDTTTDKLPLVIIVVVQKSDDGGINHLSSFPFSDGNPDVFIIKSCFVCCLCIKSNFIGSLSSFCKSDKGRPVHTDEEVGEEHGEHDDEEGLGEAVHVVVQVAAPGVLEKVPVEVADEGAVQVVADGVHEVLQVQHVVHQALQVVDHVLDGVGDVVEGGHHVGGVVGDGVLRVRKGVHQHDGGVHQVVHHVDALVRLVVCRNDVLENVADGVLGGDGVFEGIVVVGAAVGDRAVVGGRAGGGGSLVEVTKNIFHDSGVELRRILKVVVGLVRRGQAPRGGAVDLRHDGVHIIDRSLVSGPGVAAQVAGGVGVRQRLLVVGVRAVERVGGQVVRLHRADGREVLGPVEARADVHAVDRVRDHAVDGGGGVRQHGHHWVNLVQGDVELRGDGDQRGGDVEVAVQVQDVEQVVVLAGGVVAAVVVRAVQHVEQVPAHGVPAAHKGVHVAVGLVVVDGVDGVLEVVAHVRVDCVEGVEQAEDHAEETVQQEEFDHAAAHAAPVLGDEEADAEEDQGHARDEGEEPHQPSAQVSVGRDTVVADARDILRVVDHVPGIILHLVHIGVDLARELRAQVQGHAARGLLVAADVVEGVDERQHGAGVGRPEVDQGIVGRDQRVHQRVLGRGEGAQVRGGDRGQGGLVRQVAGEVDAARVVGVAPVAELRGELREGGVDLQHHVLRVAQHVKARGHHRHGVLGGVDGVLDALEGVHGAVQHVHHLLGAVLQEVPHAVLVALLVVGRVLL
mmetsp:Transcript_11732/g.20431  ORF Transcript_11732/g.20431 Transcript_11732/m.20431 type:complete len:740 (+) Transcript_11732:236-2455(+)